MKIEIFGEESDESGPRIYAIGGGKGGVGKSVLAANLGVVLAKRREKVVVVDADLGGANLHTIFGMADPELSLTDYIDGKVANLADIVLETSVPGLHLVSGAHALLEMANPKHGQKHKILRHMRKLVADYVILDLGAGTGINVLDFFLASHRGILIVVPEPTSVENAYHFINAAFARKLKQTEPRKKIAAALEKVAASRVGNAPTSARDLVAEVMVIDPEAGSAVLAAAATFAASIVVNRSVSASNDRLAAEMSMACRDYYGIGVDALGTLPTDPMVARSVIDREPVAAVHPDSPFAGAVRRIAAALTSEES
ncbi:MAG: P-loop NTPase [Thermoanaerobaculales bacterium]|nr:P-loop NTPase [Thermoanaerobaculales bacterium]